MITGVVKESSAKKSNIQYPDIIKKADGVDVETYVDLYKLVNKKNVGEKVELEILSHNKIEKKILTLEKRTLNNILGLKDFIRVHFGMEIGIEDYTKNNNTSSKKKNTNNEKENIKKFFIEKFFLSKEQKEKLKIKEGDYIYYIKPEMPNGLKENIFNIEQVEFILNNSYIYDGSIVSINFYTQVKDYKVMSVDEEILDFKRIVSEKDERELKVQNIEKNIYETPLF